MAYDITTIDRKEFRSIIGWTCANSPLSDEKLRLVRDGIYGAKVGGTLIGKNHYTLYFKYDITKDVILFPIIITDGDKCCIVKSEDDLKQFVKNPILDRFFEEKVENMAGCDYMEIREHEVAFSNRIPYTELYSWKNEVFYGYRYVEF